MALVYYAGTFITGLSTDTKPTVGDGYQFLETDTGNKYQRQGSAWVALPPNIGSNFINVDTDDLKPSTSQEGTLCYVRLTNKLWKKTDVTWERVSPDLDDILGRLDDLERMVSLLCAEMDINYDDFYNENVD